MAHSFETLIVAHRGESFDAPENTLSAINRAWHNGARAVEIDIRLTADNEIVVIHDKHTGRVGDKKLIVKRSKLHQLKRVDVGIKKSEVFQGESIPTLYEVIDTVPFDAKLLIEIKCGKEIVTPLVELLKNIKLKSKQIEIISFNLEVLISIKKNISEHKALWLLGLDYYLPHWLLKFNPQKVIKKIKENKLDGVDVWAGRVISKSFVKAFKEEGLHVYVWTVNDLNNAQKLLAYGVDAITTDRAEWLTKQLAGKER
jgi:glycerophosphoryl diester phosphodiesterase